MSNLETVEPHPAPPPSQGTQSQIIRLDLATLISENIRPRPAMIHYIDIHLGMQYNSTIQIIMEKPVLRGIAMFLIGYLAL